MSTCSKCGELIVFRLINGRTVPIHDSGECGQSSSYSSRVPRDYTPSPPKRWDHDFTRATRCPVCLQSVYFVRHNGGSVWFDELGWPWPKHACFDQPASPIASLLSISKVRKELRDAKLGVIYVNNSPESDPFPRIEIQLQDQTLVAVTLRWRPSGDRMVGDMVFVSQKHQLLIHPVHADIAFDQFQLLPRAERDWRQCARCQTWVKTENLADHEEFCRKHPPKPLRPGLLHRSPVASPGSSSEATALVDKRDKVAAKNAKALKLEVQRIAAEAWESTSGETEVLRRLKSAKKAVHSLVRKCKPAIRSQLEHEFTTTDWAPLKNLINSPTRQSSLPRNEGSAVTISKPASKDAKVLIDRLDQVAAKNVEALQLEVERIATEAWESTDGELDASQRLKSAKRAVLSLVRKSQPDIRGRLEQLFTATKWAPLQNLITPTNAKSGATESDRTADLPMQDEP